MRRRQRGAARSGIAFRLQRKAGDFLNVPLPELMGAADRAFAEPLPPHTLIKNRYRIQDLLAEGGFATVYLAHDETLARKPVVVKILDRLYPSASIRDSFLAELQSLSRLQHPNLAGLTDVGELGDGTPFLVMNYVPGQTLRQILRDGPLPEHRRRLILEGLGQALEATHLAGIWHLDVKPENVIVSGAGMPAERATLVDFGIAQLKSIQGPSTHRAATGRYAAPEQYDNPSARCDIYTLALVAFELIAGHLPDLAKPIPTQLHGVPQPIRNALAKALSADPSCRQASVTEFLDQVLPAAPKLRNRKLAAISLFAALAAGAATWTWSQTQSAERVFNPAPLVTSQGRKHDPAFSADGDWIYFAGQMGGQFDIFRQPAVIGGEPVRIVSGPANEENPAPSPDGKRLAVVRRAPNITSLFLVNSDGSGTEEELFLALRRNVTKCANGAGFRNSRFPDVASSLAALAWRP